jgi:hypothetical protein
MSDEALARLWMATYREIVRCASHIYHDPRSATVQAVVPLEPRSDFRSVTFVSTNGIAA